MNEGSSQSLTRTETLTDPTRFSGQKIEEEETQKKMKMMMKKKMKNQIEKNCLGHCFPWEMAGSSQEDHKMKMKMIHKTGVLKEDQEEMDQKKMKMKKIEEKEIGQNCFGAKCTLRLGDS